MVSIHFRDPLGLRNDLASYCFFPPEGWREADVMIEVQKIRVARGDHHIEQCHPADAIARLVERSQNTLPCNRDAKTPYRQDVGGEVTPRFCPS